MKFRVWWVPQIPMESFVVEAPDLKTARLIEDTLAKYDLFQFEHRIKPDYANTGGVQRWDEDENDWFDVESDEEVI